ncbi:MAG: BTAD domain-containing putative transcriptional regulator [Acidimicrobiales bacterium]
MEIGILGPLEVLVDGRAVEPGSPKQRALLLNLVVHHGHVVSRDRLMDDLWAGSPPSTALGVLQNYVSQLRKALGAHVVATRGPGYALDVDPTAIDSVRFDAMVDNAQAALRAGDPSSAAKAARRALELWRGDALVDVADEPFAQAEIGRLRERRVVAVELHLEAEISAGRHREAAPRLEAAVADHPFRERLWWLLMLALYRSGRQADALRAYQRARATLAEELGLEPSGQLRDLERAILDQRGDLDNLLVTTVERARPRRRSRPDTPLLGRTEEWSAVEAFLVGSDPTAGGLLLLVGEPGIGKTRLLEQARHHMDAMGGIVISGRAFEAERRRSYGPWIDALRSTPLPPLDGTQRRVLATLLPELSGEPAELDDPNLLYDAVTRLVGALAVKAPVAVLLDDVQWLDEPSTSLLHFVIRHLAHVDVAFVAAARPAELGDNGASARLLHALRRDDAVTELFVGPLTAATIADLTGPIAPGADSQRIAQATHGNPLFALEMARALARGDDPLTSRVDALIEDRLTRIDERASKLVPWLAAFGHGVPPSVLAPLVEREPADLFESLGDLERHGVIYADGEGRIDFVHDLVRTAAYKRLSTPRRAIVHARIAAVLASLADPDDSLAAETARHADAGGDSAACATASVRAARRSLRLLAYGDVEDLVALGRTHAQRLPPTERVETEVELLHVLLHPALRLRDAGELTRDLTELCAEAQRLGLDPVLSSALSLLARAYHWGWGDLPRARALMQRAAQLIENAEEPSLEPLLEGARCLAYLEMDMDRTARLFDELGALDALASTSFQYQWGLGLVEAWRGDLRAARAAMRRAIDLAAGRADHWATFECTARLALLELEAGAVDAAESLSAELAPLASKLGDGSERPYAAAIGAIARIARGDPNGQTALDDAIRSLERIDARFLVPDLLGVAAEIHRHAGDPDLARDRAEWAAQVADDAARPFEAARAHALLACLAAERGDFDDARSHIDAVVSRSDKLPGHVQGLRLEAERLVDAGLGEQGVDAWR